MNTNENSKKLILYYPKLSYTLVGICFLVHNELGRYAKEKKYSDLIEKKLKDSRIPFRREYQISGSGNIVDFLVDGKIILEIKAKRLILKEDYFQTQHYLQETKIKLALIVNFRDKYLKPIRVIRIDTRNKHKFRVK